MELGNMIWGNSRGVYPLDRGTYEDIFQGFLEDIGLDGYGNNVHPEFNNLTEAPYNSSVIENETFSIFPYYWGDCTCGFEDMYNEACSLWFKQNQHSKDCYQTKLEEAKVNSGKYTLDETFDYLKYTGELNFSEEMDWEREFIYKPLLEEFGLTQEGCAVHCTCGLSERFEAFSDSLGNHSEKCPTIIPNFLFKPTGYTISWYKYPLRDSYSNMDLPIEDFKEMLIECIRLSKGAPK